MQRLICKLLGLAFLFLPSIAWADHCTITQISITSGSWENTPTKTSYTLQAQDASGDSCHASETLRFSLESTGSGTFTSQSGGNLSFFISTNTAIRNFYYSGHPASYTLTAKAGYGLADSWTVQFTDTHTVGENSNEVSETNSTNQASSAPVYSQINQASVSIKLNIGKDRAGSVGSPMFFKADVNLKNIQNGDFRWNFGDGSEGYGRELVHVYEYPGEYVVVLSLGSMGGESARLNVKVVEQDLSILAASPERIEIKNNSKYEADLSGKALVVGDRSFIFPQDTIIKPGASISFGSKVTGLNPTVPVAVHIFATGTTEHPKITKRIEEEKVEKIVQIQNQLAALKQQMASITPPPANLAVQQLSEEESSEPEEPEEVEVVESQTAVAVKSGWFDMLKRFFLRTR